jgi:hypothetical protein
MWKRANKRIEITAKSMGDALEIIKVEFSPKWEISMIWPEYVKEKEFTLQDSINEFFKCFPPKISP